MWFYTRKNNEKECVEYSNHEHTYHERNAADPLKHIGVDTIDYPVSQLDKTTGVKTVYDPYDNLQYDTDQRYEYQSSQYRLRTRKILKNYWIPKIPRKRKFKSPDVATIKRPKQSI